MSDAVFECCSSEQMQYEDEAELALTNLNPCHKCFHHK